MSGFRVWRQNNNAVFDPKIKRFRKNSATKGIPDVIGYQKHTARFIAVEVKAGKDTLSPEQIEFLQNLERFGGIAIVARDFSTFLSEIQAITDTMKSGQIQVTAGNQAVKYLESPVVILSNLTGQGD
jgi:Holliday junction resolvase